MKRFNWPTIRLLLMLALVIFLYSFTCKTHAPKGAERQVQHMYETSNVGKYQPVVIGIDHGFSLIKS